MPIPRAPRIAIAGATGAVGHTLIELIEKRDFPFSAIDLLASTRSSGKTLKVKGQSYPVQSLADFHFGNVHLAFFSCGTSVSRVEGRRAAMEGALVIDNTNAFRMDADTPLVVPQVNAHQLATRPTSGIIANPNCSTIPLVRLLQPIDRLYGIQQVIVSTYQAASGAGLTGIEELKSSVTQTLNAPESSDTSNRRFPVPLGFNLIPSIDVAMPTGFTLEEQKMLQESRKILEQPDLKLSATCVRVPVINGHSESAYIQCDRPVDREKVVQALRETSEVEVFDAGSGSVVYPTPRYLQNPDKVHVGRIRIDPNNPCALWLWLIADNLRIGAALNAIQIAEVLIQQADKSMAA
ncbi:MAG: aspartate-semialdehyde dehydrogenase [Alphaproteobacteria bacterium]